MLRKRSADEMNPVFPDEASLGGKKSAAEGTLKAWTRCGEGFDDCSVEMKTRSSGRKLKAVRHLAQSFFIEEETSAEDSGKDPADIVWSSSDSDSSSDGLGKAESLPDICELSPKHEKTLQETDTTVDCSGADIPHISDWQDDSDLDCGLDKSNASETDESLVEISDSESSTSDLLVSQQCQPEQLKVVDIVEYSSSDEPVEEPCVPTEERDIPVTEENVLPSGGRSASDWLKTAQILLQTPEKKLDKTFKTPEDSAKKKKHFLRGGLAERLSRLQNRERSAITFWRHQSDSDCRILSGDKSGTLLIKVTEVHEECTVWIALCHQLTDLQNVDDHPMSQCLETAKLKVLFSRQTAAQVKPKLNDIIHIYPPWQKLTVKDTSVIINTHFSQRIVVNPSVNTENKMYCPGLFTVKKRLVPLSVVFQIDNVESSCDEDRQSKQWVSSYGATTHSALCNQEKCLSLRCTVNDSLLDLVETQGAAGWKGACVRAVIQRVYYLTSRISPGCLHQDSSKSNPDTAAKAPNPDFRLCLLIQDSYGMFSELQLQSSNCPMEVTEKYCKELEGKCCCFSGLKTLQRTTRGRAPGLFSLIDSLWPPIAPIKIHGQSQEQGQVPCNLPAPSFCYVLALRYEEGSDGIRPEDEVSDLYLPPVINSLEEILQVVILSQRCSFWATVIYVRPEVKGNLLEHKEFCFYVTDETLQMAPNKSGVPRVLSVCVLPSCAVDSRVLDAFSKKSPCNIFFKDAVKENCRIICAERTVLSLQNPLLSHASGANELTGPAKLDELDSATEANSLCLVTGIITGVNERESFSWPVCNLCGSSKLKPCHSDRHAYYCLQCGVSVSSPVIRMQLEVFLHSELCPGRTVKLKLQRDTISSLLSSCPSEDGRYEVGAVLGKQVGPVPCYVQSVNSNVGLEEICLLQAETSGRHRGLDFTPQSVNG
ncbi:DNA repair-scaffolding protein [Hyperolius riggenbachi]|uniref:DNA repair-scaffolding protein n=1 Tax=Hyperolius riggenbachi TaxID=752182 RepID=UPI0035A2689F